MSLYTFHLGQIILSILGTGQHGNAARTPIRGCPNPNQSLKLTTPKNNAFVIVLSTKQ